MRILAHRTAMANAPPNSLAGLQFCWARGINVAECDLSFTRDKQPIIWHDENNNLLAQPIHSINKLTLEEMRGLGRKDCEERLLILDDIWSFLKAHPGFRILFDIKYYHKKICIEADFWGVVKRIPRRLVDLTLQRVVQPAIEAGLIDQIGFVTFTGGKELLGAVKKIDRRVFTSLIVVQPWIKIADHLAYVDAVTVGWGWRGLNHWWLCPGRVERMVEEVKKNGREIWGGLARNSSHVEWLMYHGFDRTWADDINMVRKVLGSEI